MILGVSAIQSVAWQNLFVQAPQRNFGRLHFGYSGQCFNQDELIFARGSQPLLVVVE
jgi:hypothetical protein